MTDAAAVALARKLDGLPLALSTAGAYLMQVSTSWRQYLQDYESVWDQLQKLSPQLLTYENRAMYSTWNISFESIRRQSESAAMLLRLWAFFGNEDLWYELLRKELLWQGGMEDGPQWFRDLTETRLAFDQTMRVLCSHGLVEPHSTTAQTRSESSGYSVHACVHSWMIHVLNGPDEQDLAALAMKCTSLHVPEHEIPEYWLIERRLLPHADRCRQLLGEVDDESRAWMSSSLGFFYMGQGRYKEAEAMLERTLEGCEKVWGPAHSWTLDAVTNLGTTYLKRGRYKEAETMLERALEGYEKAWGHGPEHTSTLDTVNNLGLVYFDQGRYKEAEAMYERALKGYEKVQGPGHTSTFNTVNNLGCLYTDQGRYTEAEAMYERALKGYEKAWGLEHALTLNTVNNLGCLYVDQGRYKEAEAMYERALEGKEKVWGLEHTSTLDTVNNLGLLYADQGQHKEAETMYKRALEGKEKAWGREHISTLSTIYNLSLLYTAQRRFKEAKVMHKRALEGFEKALGEDAAAAYVASWNAVNNRVASSYAVTNLADVRRAARVLGFRVSAGVRKVFGDGSHRLK
jgi:tetratricopeptide (TPR) repeat protein